MFTHRSVTFQEQSIAGPARSSEYTENNANTIIKIIKYMISSYQKHHKHLKCHHFIKSWHSQIFSMKSCFLHPISRKRDGYQHVGKPLAFTKNDLPSQLPEILGSWAITKMVCPPKIEGTPQLIGLKWLEIPHVPISKRRSKLLKSTLQALVFIWVLMLKSLVLMVM